MLHGSFSTAVVELHSFEFHHACTMPELQTVNKNNSILTKSTSTFYHPDCLTYYHHHHHNFRCYYLTLHYHVIIIIVIIIIVFIIIIMISIIIFYQGKGKLNILYIVFPIHSRKDTRSPSSHCRWDLQIKAHNF